MASVTATVRCPPFCKADCEVTHHPLLVAVLNAVDTDDADLMNERIGALEETFQKYAEVIFFPFLRCKCVFVLFIRTMVDRNQ